MRDRNFLMISESEHHSDMRYISGFKAPDPFICSGINGTLYLIVGSMEVGRAVKESSADEVFTTKEFKQKNDSDTSLAVVFLNFLEKKFPDIDTFDVTADFPTLHADILRQKGITLSPVRPPFFPQRRVKSTQEVAYITEAVQAAQQSFERVQEILSDSEIGAGGVLQYQGDTLTSEKLKKAIQVVLAENNCVATGTIAASGLQACDPHCSGYGPLKGGEFIVVDVFPRSIETGYHGDMTRTFLKGTALAEQKKQYDTVLKAQKEAIKAIKPRVALKTVHNTVVDVFEQADFDTGVMDGVHQGFIHSTGHGIGLDVHEEPRVSSGESARIRTGYVFTVEPGLYYQKTGGVRIEDDVLVTSAGCSVISDFPYDFEV